MVGPTKGDRKLVLPNSDLLYPHRKALATVLAEYEGHYHTLFLGFDLVKLDCSVLELFSLTLAARRLTSLFFLNNDLQREELFMVSNIVENTPTLKSMSICRNRLDQGEEAVAKLGTALRHHPRLERLMLVSCDISAGKGLSLLSCIRNRSLKTIDLGSNGIDPEGAYFIAKFIAKGKGRVSKSETVVVCSLRVL